MFDKISFESVDFYSFYSKKNGLQIYYDSTSGLYQMWVFLKFVKISAKSLITNFAIL